MMKKSKIKHRTLILLLLFLLITPAIIMATLHMCDPDCRGYCSCTGEYEESENDPCCFRCLDGEGGPVKKTCCGDFGMLEDTCVPREY